MNSNSTSSKINELGDTLELYNRIRNEKRKKILVYIYKEERTYTQLMDHFLLKPGSLYHHLNTLNPLITKKGHGLYKITDLGKKVVHEYELLGKGGQKPKVAKSQETDNRPTIMTEKDETTSIDEPLDVEQNPVSNVYLWEDKYFLDILLGKNGMIIMGFTMLITVFLGIQGVSLAGSAIYSVGGYLAFLYDIIAFVLGIFVLSLIEDLQKKFPVYDKRKYIISIRIFSMFPATVIGLGLFLIFLRTGSLSDIDFTWIFLISLLFGMLISSIGIILLRSEKIQNALIISSIISMVDLLLGLSILIYN